MSFTHLLIALFSAADTFNESTVSIPSKTNMSTQQIASGDGARRVLSKRKFLVCGDELLGPHVDGTL